VAKKDVPSQSGNFRQYEEKVNMANDKELKLFEDFYKQIKDRALGHKHTTLNNLHDTEQSLSDLKEKANQLKDSVFYHDETVIVDRQAIISKTEDKIHDENINILHYEFNQAGERIDSLDYLNKALIQTKYNFFDRFRDFYANQILDYNELYHFYQEKATEFDNVMNRYYKEILSSFQKLDNDITAMDNQISVLIQQKNSKLNKLNSFYDNEMEHYLDNQSTFSVDDDPNSRSMKTMISNKIEQLDSFKLHMKDQEQKVKKILHDEYSNLYTKTLNRLLQRKGNELFDNVDFFFHPEMSINKMKEEIVEAGEQEFTTLKTLISKYNQAIQWKSIKAKSKQRAKRMTKGFLETKKHIYLEFQKESKHLILQMEKYYKLYIELLKIDPFLAQIIGDNSTKIIKDEVNFLSILQMNQEHKINVNFDIKTLKLKQQINEIESELAYQSEKLMIQQDIDILNTLRDIQMFFAKNQGNSALIFNSLTKEKYIIERLEKAVNYHMEHLVKESNLNRKFLYIITQILNTNIRKKESHNVRVVDATSRIKLALKKFDVLALHYNTLYENEKRFLVLQSNRVSEESKINNEFILTTFENQMRFASEQILLANDEYKLRVESIMRAFDEEREYYNDVIKHKLKGYQQRQKNISDEYQAKLYYDSFLIQESDDTKQKKELEKQIAKNKETHDKMIAKIEEQISADKEISEARGRLQELDGQLEVSLGDAETIRNDTIDEMSELYQDAKNRYDALKPYLENKMNILDPTFYQSLARIKQRHMQKIKVAENELDRATQDLMDKFLIVYFEEQPKINKELYLSQMEQLQEERDLLRKEYSNKIEKTELEYDTKMVQLDKDMNQILNHIDELKSSVTHRSGKEIQQKQMELNTLEKHYDVNYEKQRTSFQNAIAKLTNEYNQSLVSNQKYYRSLSDAFDKILKTYYPYLKAAKNNKIIKQIVKNNEKRMKKAKAIETKKMVKTSKMANYLND